VVITTEADICGNIQDFSEYVEEIRDIFKRMVTFLKNCLLTVYSSIFF
jgi:hypothetical protein